MRYEVRVFKADLFINLSQLSACWICSLVQANLISFLHGKQEVVSCWGLFNDILAWSRFAFRVRGKFQ